MHHAFMHLVSVKSHEAPLGHPFVLAENTSLEEYKHALVDLLIVAAAEMKKEATSLVIETIED